MRSVYKRRLLSGACLSPDLGRLTASQEAGEHFRSPAFFLLGWASPTLQRWCRDREYRPSNDTLDSRYLYRTLFLYPPLQQMRVYIQSHTRQHYLFGCMAYIGNFCQYVLDWKELKIIYYYEYNEHCAFRKAQRIRTA